MVYVENCADVQVCLPHAPSNEVRLSLTLLRAVHLPYNKAPCLSVLMIPQLIISLRNLLILIPCGSPSRTYEYALFKMAQDSRNTTGGRGFIVAVQLLTRRAGKIVMKTIMRQRGSYIIANVIKCEQCLLLTPKKPSVFSIR